MYMYVYCGTSDKGHSLLGRNTKNYLNNIHVYKGQEKNDNFSVYFQPLRRGHLPIKDNSCWSQGVLYTEVHLYTCKFHKKIYYYYASKLQGQSQLFAVPAATPLRR